MLGTRVLPPQKAGLKPWQEGSASPTVHTPHVPTAARCFVERAHAVCLPGTLPAAGLGLRGRRG